MPSLVVSSWSIPAAVQLANAARNANWTVLSFEEDDVRPSENELVYYGSTEIALTVASKLEIALFEPPFDLLAHLPRSLSLRTVELRHFRELDQLKSPTFVKPADPLNKSFDAGVYSNVRDIRRHESVDKNCLILVAQPVEWTSEYRCFIADRNLAAWSPYISFGRPNWKPFGAATIAQQIPPNLIAFCNRLFAQASNLLPPAFVVDIGFIEEQGWGVVEFNPIWCSGLLGADPSKVLAALSRGCRSLKCVTENDRRWLPCRA